MQAQANTEPTRSFPANNWEHFLLWKRIYDILEVLPKYFKSEILIKGINVTDIYAVGNLFSAIIESQIVDILNSLRGNWDEDNEYSDYSFIRQSQTFPDILFTQTQDTRNIIFGIELKAWYVFSKESEPSFRYTIDPDSCNVQDLLVVTPWFLSDVLSGNPLLLFPYIELAKYGAEFRNFHWSNSRNSSGNRSSNIIRPPESFRHPYPRSKEEASDKAEHDKGNNFGRIARSGILDNYLSSIKKIDYLGIKISHWMKIFKAMSENKTMQEIDIQLETILRTVKSDIENSQSQKPHLLIFKELLENLNALKENLP